MKGSTDSGVTLVEVLISTAVAAIALAGAAGLLAASARAVAESELETTAIWIASRTVEEWRSQAAPALDGVRDLDRDGQIVAAPGLFRVAWIARPADGVAEAWLIKATVTSGRLRQPIVTEVVVQESRR